MCSSDLSGVLPAGLSRAEDHATRDSINYTPEPLNADAAVPRARAPTRTVRTGTLQNNTVLGQRCTPAMCTGVRGADRGCHASHTQPGTCGCEPRHPDPISPARSARHEDEQRADIAPPVSGSRSEQLKAVETSKRGSTGRRRAAARPSTRPSPFHRFIKTAGAAKVPLHARREIGRASCRERV